MHCRPGRGEEGASQRTASRFYGHRRAASAHPEICRGGAAAEGVWWTSLLLIMVSMRFATDGTAPSMLSTGVVEMEINGELELELEYVGDVVVVVAVMRAAASCRGTHRSSKHALLCSI